MLLPWKLSNHKKTEKAMNNQDIEKLVSLKENFTGQKFQWVKTDRLELLGKVVVCRYINKAAGGRFYAYFDDGSKVDTADLNRNLLMIHGDMQPLSKDEVLAIYKPKSAFSNQPTLEPSPNPNIQPVMQSRMTSSPIGEPRSQEARIVTPIPEPKTNMFSMFNSEDSQISLNVTVRLPERKLLKMMYTNAENKDKFLSELSEYIQAMINNKIVRESVEQILSPTTKSTIKKDSEPDIKVRELE